MAGGIEPTRLNRRQREVLHLICRGLRNSEIAALLHLRERTIKWYVSQLFLVLDVTNRTELAAMCAQGDEAFVGAARPAVSATSPMSRERLSLSAGTVLSDSESDDGDGYTQDR